MNAHADRTAPDTRVMCASTRGACTREVPVLALSPDEAAAALSLSRTFFDEHVAAELKWIRRGRRKFVAVRELERWIAANEEHVLG